MSDLVEFGATAAILSRRAIVDDRIELLRANRGREARWPARGSASALKVRLGRSGGSWRVRQRHGVLFVTYMGPS